MILVHRDQEVTFFNDKTKKYFTSRYGLGGPIDWDYNEHISNGSQNPIGYDVLGWW